MFLLGNADGDATESAGTRTARPGATRGANRWWRRPAPVVGSGVVYFAGSDWWYHNRAHADFQLAQRLATRTRVLLVNSIGTRLPRPGRTASFTGRIRRKLRAISRGVRRPVDGLPDFYVYSPLVLPAYGSALWRSVATGLLRAQTGLVRWWLRVDRTAIVVTLPTAWPVVQRLRPDRVVFVRSDKHSALPEADTTTVRHYEEELLRNADSVVYVCSVLQAEDEPLVGERAVFLDHGVDSDLFDPATPEATELRDLPRPIVGYFGTLRDHTVDGALLRRVAEELPDATLVVVGPSTMDLSELEALPNVRIFGAQEHGRVPAFGVAFDVGIMPWLDNEWIRNCNPIKLKEYLALGLPVVTTYFPEAERWPVRTAKGADEFIAEVRAALADPGDRLARRGAVAGESWTARGELLYELIDPGRQPSSPSAQPAGERPT
jgi:glycosyltransferase involved in cell wall biosynthesis